MLSTSRNSTPKLIARSLLPQLRSERAEWTSPAVLHDQLPVLIGGNLRKQWKPGNTHGRGRPAIHRWLVEHMDGRPQRRIGDAAEQIHVPVRVAHLLPPETGVRGIHHASGLISGHHRNLKIETIRALEVALRQVR